MAKKPAPPQRTGTQGWKQFLTGRKEMLDAYDSARSQSQGHKVETSHGNVAEASFRKWLSDFLPRKYGVTSGYIVSQGVNEPSKKPHFDVIIYDKLESPVLWVEGDPDLTKAGTSQAIPAEHVHAVLEVKAALTTKSAKDAVEHLNKLRPLLSGRDALDEHYPKYVPPRFVCGCVFFEARRADVEFSKVALNRLVEPHELRGYNGALVLRGEDLGELVAGRVKLCKSDTSMKSTVGRKKRSFLQSTWADTIEVDENTHIGAMVTWSEAHFGIWAFDLVAQLAGRFRTGYLSSFHAMSWQK